MESKEVVMKSQVKKGLWKPEEDLILKKYVETHGEGNWTTVSERSGLMRGGKSCRLRWKNYLRPNIKRGRMSEDEKDLIIRLHKLLGNRWSLIAGRLPGRTDNEVKNYWNTHLNKRCPRGKTPDINYSTNDHHRTLQIPPPPPPPPPHPNHTQNLEDTNEAVKRSVEGKLIIPDHPHRTDNINSFTCGIQSPPLLLVNDHSLFYYDDDDPFFPNFLFSGALGTSEHNYSQDGSQLFLM